MSEHMLQNDDPFEDPLWKEAEKAARATPRRRRSKTFIGCPLWWLRWVLPLTRSEGQLAAALWVYRLRVVQRSKTVSISNQSLEEALGISRFAKYRVLAKLEDAGVLTVERRDGRAIKVTLLR